MQTSIAQRLPSVESVRRFLDALSNRIFFKLIRTPEQRAWLARLGVLTLSFTRSIAFRLAALQPSIQVTEADWRYLRSLVLDQSGADHYSVPRLIRELATSEAQMPDANTILIAAARHVFSTAVATRKIDFLDFQNAIFSLIAATAYEEAAMRFIFSFASLAGVGSFEPFEFLFLVLNGLPIHGKVTDPGTRWLLLNAEAGLRLQDRAGAADPRVAQLLRRMRPLFHEDWTSTQSKLYFRAMHHVTVCFARVRRATADAGPRTLRRSQKFAAPIHSALRLALLSDDQDLIRDVLHIYDQIHVVARRPDMKLIKGALLRMATQPAPISTEALVTLYAQYVITLYDGEAALRVVREHSAEYVSKGLNDAYFACVHAEATALLERSNEPGRARELIRGLLARPGELKPSAHCVARGELLIADAYWMEKNYSESRHYYQSASEIEYADPFLRQYIAERVCDSWMQLGQYKEAGRLALRPLRKGHSTLPNEYKARFCARMAYAYALDGEWRKAAVSCFGLCKTAQSEDSDALYCLAATVAAWVLSCLDYSDPAIPKNDVQIRDSSALSDEIPLEQVQAYRESDPFKTKGIILVATIFELLGQSHDLRRSEFLFRRALGVVEGVGESHPQYLDASYALRLRIARLEIQQGRFSEAAGSFKAALSTIVERARREGSEISTEGPGVGVVLHFLEPKVKGCTDAGVGTFFESICGRFRDNPGVCAWLHYCESKILFERYLVQGAKRELLQAERLARDVGDKLLVAHIIFDKLFNRVKQFYPVNRNAWLADALDAAAVLVSDEMYADNRDPFADNVRMISSHQQGPPFDELNAVVSRLQDSSKDQIFLVITYAMWRASTKHGLSAGSLNTLETYLRKKAKFLTEDDFH